MRYWKPKDVGSNPPKVGVVVATYAHGPKLVGLLGSLWAQTYKNLNVYVVHDGPWPADARVAAPIPEASRTTYLHTQARENAFGHNCRELGRQAALAGGCEVIGFTNGDNLYAPVFVEALVAAMHKEGSDLAYSNAIHSHLLWRQMDTSLKRGAIDVGCWLARAALVRDRPWDQKEFAADWFYLEKILLEKKPKVSKVKACLFFHN